MRCCRVLEVSYEQTESRRCPPTRGCPGGRQVASAPSTGRWGETAKQAERRWPPLAGRSCFMWGLGINPERCLFVGLEGYSPLQCCSVHTAGLDAQSDTGGSRRERSWEGLTNLVKYWRGAFVGRHGTWMLSCVTSAWRSCEEHGLFQRK